MSGQHTSNDSTIFTGFRWENRFRPLLHDHFINPVLYLEYENLNELTAASSKSWGTTASPTSDSTNAQGRAETERSAGNETDSLQQR